LINRESEFVSILRSGCLTRTVGRYDRWQAATTDAGLFPLFCRHLLSIRKKLYFPQGFFMIEEMFGLAAGTAAKNQETTAASLIIEMGEQ
jgi:hypothetical protein